MIHLFTIIYSFHLLTIIVETGEILIVDIDLLSQYSIENHLNHASIGHDLLSNLSHVIQYFRESSHLLDPELQSSLLCTTLESPKLNPEIIQQFPFIINYFLAHRNGGVNALDWSWNESYIASCGDDKTVRIFDAKTSKTLKLLHGHYNIVYSVKFSPSGTLIASASFDETVKIWSSLTGECLRSLSAHTDPVTSVDFSHDGSIIMSSGYDGHVRLWDTSTGQCLKSFISSQLLKNPPVSCARFSPNSNFCIGLLFDGCIRLWKCDTTAQVSQSNRVGTGGAIRVYSNAHRMHGKYLTNLEWFLPDSNQTFIAIPSEPEMESHYISMTAQQHVFMDRSEFPLPGASIVLYDVQTKKVIQKATTEYHQSVITYISSSKNRLFSCDQDGNVVIWKWESSEESS